MADEVVNAAGNAEALADEQSKVNSNESTSAETDKVGETAEQQESQNQPDDEKPHRKGGWQRKIEKLERTNEYLMQELLKRNAPQEPAKSEPAKQDEPAEPDPDSFDTVADYLKAVRAFDREQMKREFARTLEETKKADAEKSKKLTVEEQWAKNLTETKQKYTDFDEVLQENQPFISDAMVPAIKRAGAEILYYLGQHPEESQSIAQMEHVDMLRAIGKIEARLEFQKSQAAKEAEEKEEKPTPPSAAPPPITPVRKSGPAHAPTIYDKDLPFKEYVRLREEQIKRAK